MEIKLKYLFVAIFFLGSCTTSRFISKDLIGTYVQQENKNVQLILNEKTFLCIDKHEPFDLAPPCCDTITYGSWGIDHGFLKLNSPDELTSYFVFMDVEEKVKEDEFIYFYFENPIERVNYGELYYSIYVTGKGVNYQDIVSKEFNKYPIKISKPKYNIEKFEITIAPKCDIYTRHLREREFYTLEYEVKNANSNVFKINLPQLSYNFISHKSLKGDYVKIANKNKLIWDGKDYIKK